MKIHNLALGKYPIRVIESDNMPDNMLAVVSERAAERLIAIDEFIERWKHEFEPEFTQDELRQIYYSGEAPCQQK